MGKGMLAKLGGVGIAIIVALGFFAFDIIKEKAAAPEVGDCVVVTGGSEKAEVDTKKCGKDTLWKVAADDGKCDEMENTYFVEVNGKNAVNLCLAHDVTVGECIEIADDLNVMDKTVACSAKPANKAVIVKVTKIDTASADVKCGKDEFALPNVTRKTSMCVGAPA